MIEPLDKTWQVTRFCCTSGMCLTCRAFGNSTRRQRIVHADRLTEKMAKAMVKNWRSYDAKAEPMSRCPRCGSPKPQTQSCDCFDNGSQ